jgi:hypothetical protein
MKKLKHITDNMSSIYKGDLELKISKKESLTFETETNYSEPNSFLKMVGYDMEYCENREVLYLFPRNSNGKHALRWQSIEKKDIKTLIKTLEKFI